MKSDFITYGIWALFALGIASFAYQAWKKGGLKAAMFGAQIGRTVGTLDLGKSGPMSTTLKVHCLESKGLGTPAVGIELVHRSALSYHMMPISLTSEQASVLRGFLSQAVAESQGSYREHAVSLATQS
jgi:hypothetical protein